MSSFREEAWVEAMVVKAAVLYWSKQKHVDGEESYKVRR